MFYCLLTFDRLDNQADHNALNAYVAYVFDYPLRTAPGVAVHEHIVKYWLRTISDEFMEGFSSYWFLFAIITKSMVLI